MPTTYDLLVAFYLLSLPAGTPEPTPPPDMWPAMQAALHQVAIEKEILDPRETRYVLSRVEDFECDLNMLRRRFKDLEDAPLVSDSMRFPDRKDVNAMVVFNRAYLKNLETRRVWESDRADIITQAINETQQLYHVWDAVRDARCEFYYVTVRRQALLKLRGLIGENDYYEAKLPPYVPIWRFTEIK